MKQVFILTIKLKKIFFGRMLAEISYLSSICTYFFLFFIYRINIYNTYISSIIYFQENSPTQDTVIKLEKK